MNNYHIAKWTKEHLREFRNDGNGGKVAVFRIDGKQLEVPITAQAWQIALKKYQAMDVLRQSVMAIVMQRVRYYT